jgi:branched-chain amino acid transport system ATP-binding protein
MLLELSKVQAGYGNAQILFDVSLHVGEGEAVTLIGRNGMGKTTTVNAIMGICQPVAGEIRFKGEEVHRLPSHQIAKRGIGLIPEGRRIFPNLTVQENLVVALRAMDSTRAWTVTKVLALFPRIEERLSQPGYQLSGGEQQMLAIGRALLTNPDLLIFDEATEGLAPIVREEIWSTLKLLKQAGVSMIVIDKDIEALCELASRHYIIEKGRIVWEGASSELFRDQALQHRFLSIGGA